MTVKLGHLPIPEQVGIDRHTYRSFFKLQQEFPGRACRGLAVRHILRTQSTLCQNRTKCSQHYEPGKQLFCIIRCRRCRFRTVVPARNVRHRFLSPYSAVPNGHTQDRTEWRSSAGYGPSRTINTVLITTKPATTHSAPR